MSAQHLFSQGCQQFERGDYRGAIATFSTALSQSEPHTKLGGDIQIWLVMTYDAQGDRPQANALCTKLQLHNDPDTRQQAKRLLYILEAPRLAPKPEWLVQIPDLSDLDDRDGHAGGAASLTAPRNRTPKPPPPAIPDPVDPTQVNIRDNQFIWLALGTSLIVVLSLLWFST